MEYGNISNCLESVYQLQGGGGYKTGGGSSEVLLYKKGERERFVILKGGHKRFWGSLNTGA